MTFKYLLNSTNQSAKPTDLTMIYIFSLLITFLVFFSFLISYTSKAIIDVVEFLFSCPKMCLKINLSVKTPWRRPSKGVSNSELWALLAWTGMWRWTGYIFRVLSLQQGIFQFHYMASWTKCLVGPEALNRSWRLAIDCLRKKERT